MKTLDVMEMSSTELRIYPLDTIPYDLFLLEDSIKKFQSAFNISKQDLPLPPVEGISQKFLIFNRGKIERAEKSVVILSIEFVDRKITIQTKGDSNDTKYTFTKLFEYFKSIDSNKSYDPDGEIIRTYETKSVVKIDIPFDKFISPRMNKFIRGIKKKEKDTISEIAPAKFQFLVTFKQDQSLLDKANIHLSSKLLVLEPRQGHHYSEKIYFFSTPTDSKKHLELLRELVAVFNK